MFRLLKRLFSILLVLLGIALILNLNIGGRPSRDHAVELWRSEGVQKVYRVVRDRFLALIRKDISVEEVFKPELPKKTNEISKADPASTQSDETKAIQLENLDEKDRKALEEILKKSRGGSRQTDGGRARTAPEPP